MFRRLTIARRLTLGFGLFLAMLVAAIVLGLSRLSALEIIVERIVSKDWQKTVLAKSMLAGAHWRSAAPKPQKTRRARLRMR